MGNGIGKIILNFCLGKGYKGTTRYTLFFYGNSHKHANWDSEGALKLIGQYFITIFSPDTAQNNFRTLIDN